MEVNTHLSLSKKLIKKVTLACTVTLIGVLISPQSEAQVFKTIDSWSYIPLDKPFWDQSQELLINKSWDDLFKKTNAQINKNKGSSLQAEALMVKAQACKSLNLKACTYLISLGLLKEYPNSAPSLLALTEIESVLKENNFYDKSLIELANSGIFNEIPLESLPFISYLTFQSNQLANLTRFSLANSAKINPKSFWYKKFNYYLTLEKLKKLKTEDSIAELEKIISLIQDEPYLKNRALINLARLHFENQNYTQAQEFYTQVTPEFREESQLRLELAWTYYWKRQYSDVLGIIKELKSPHLKHEFNPEVYLLEMITLRSLCHFESINAAFKEYQKKFNTTLDAIKMQSNLSNNKDIALLTINDGQIKRLTYLISEIIQDINFLKSQNVISKNNVSDLITFLNQEKKFYTNLAELAIRKALDEKAKYFVSIYEQLQLLDYLAGIDKNSLNLNKQSNKYTPVEIPNTDFSILYWPVEEEYWLDEIKNFKVLVNDHCGAY